MNYQWIKIRHKLLRSPKLFILMRELAISQAEAVGLFVMALAIFDEHSEDGLLKNTTPDVLDSMVGKEGFTELISRDFIGWIDITEEGIRIKDWDKHNSVEAKKKAIQSKRNKLKREHPVFEPKQTKAAPKQDLFDDLEPATNTRSMIREVAEERKQAKSDAKKVLEWVNEIGGKNYKPRETHLKFIEDRLRTKDVTLEGVRQMLEHKWSKWKGTDQEQYWRPQTLFNKTKFEQYYDEKDFVSKAKESTVDSWEKVVHIEPDGTGIEQHESWEHFGKPVWGKIRSDYDPNDENGLFYFNFLFSEFKIDEEAYTQRILRERAEKEQQNDNNIGEEN